DNGKRHAEIAVRRKAGPRLLLCGGEGGGRWQSVGGLYRVCDDGGMLRPGRVLAGGGAGARRRRGRPLPVAGALWRVAGRGRGECWGVGGAGAWAAGGGSGSWRGGFGGLRRGGGGTAGWRMLLRRGGLAVCGAVTQGCCGGRERPPYIMAGNGQRRVRGSSL